GRPADSAHRLPALHPVQPVDGPAGGIPAPAVPREGVTPVRLIPATATAPPPTLRRIAARVDARLGDLLAGETARWSAVDSGLVEPLEALTRLVLSGGKRLRPAFCHWAFVGAGGDWDDPAVVDAGAALELLHTFALI